MQPILHTINGNIEPDSPLTTFINTFLKDEAGLSCGAVRGQTLAGDGSVRNFYRIIPAQHKISSYIVMVNTPTNLQKKRENLAYLRIGNHLFKKGLPVPQIYRFDLVNGWFVLEDMGDRHLQEETALHRDKIPIYEKVLETLFQLQIEGSKGFNPEWCCQTKRYDKTVMRRYETDYFRDAFLHNYLGKNEDLSFLEGPFDHLSSIALKAENHHFLHRDFQSRNIMIYGNRIGILDWQGSRLGPLSYDLASLLIDPYVDLLDHEREQIYRLYLRLLKGYRPTWIPSFKRYFPYLAIQRNLQILGAFSFLTKTQKKPRFETYIPAALKSLQSLLDNLNDPGLLPLRDLLKGLPFPEKDKRHQETK